jgi:L-ascorbate metabolism protein UlaG (beta-lactamase superfamily)
MKQLATISVAAMLGAAALAATPAAAQNVKVTPLGTHDGEFCALDRAMVFEDPNGTRVLYDAGRSVAGPGDPRLGKIDIILVSHMHGDHVGNSHIPAVNAGTCGKADTSVDATPNTSTVNIALAKNSTIVTGSEMPPFFSAKLKANGGDPKKSILVRFGATKEVGGVKISTVPALHSNGLSPSFIGGELGKHMEEAGFAGYVGQATGYILQFTNGLVVYLSGDTGMTAEQEKVVNGYYKAELAVINIGDTFTTGPQEAAYVINDLIKPKSVIASHANEPSTEGGKLIAGGRTAVFKAAVKVPVHLPLSGKTMEFNGDATCVSGC